MRARQRLQREGEAGFLKVRRGRRRHGIEKPEILQRFARMLADGTSLRRTARELDLCYATLRTWRLNACCRPWRRTREPQRVSNPRPHQRRRI